MSYLFTLLAQFFMSSYFLVTDLSLGVHLGGVPVYPGLQKYSYRAEEHLLPEGLLEFFLPQANPGGPLGLVVDLDHIPYSRVRLRVLISHRLRLPSLSSQPASLLFLWIGGQEL